MRSSEGAGLGAEVLQRALDPAATASADAVADLIAVAEGRRAPLEAAASRFSLRAPWEVGRFQRHHGAVLGHRGAEPDWLGHAVHSGSTPLELVALLTGATTVITTDPVTAR